ncbi:MAG: hypothetical protein ACTIDI_01755 [Pseudolactococcus laudensis]
MQFHILDENYTPVAVMDNDLPDAIHFSNSKFHRFLTGSADFLILKRQNYTSTIISYKSDIGSLLNTMTVIGCSISTKFQRLRATR